MRGGDDASSTPGKVSDAQGDDDLRLGRVVAAKYRLDRVLASGGMGTVYEAEHLRLGRRVALKLMHPDKVADDERARRFHKEARRAASLEHRGIVEVRDFGHDAAAGPYLEMELLEGANVERLLLGYGPLPLDVALYIVSETLDALSTAHGRNIVHRDLKPNNLFVSLTAGGGVQVKVVDFGIARMFHSELEGLDPQDDSFSETLTRTGILLGTLNYMSPEQFADPRNVDHRSDLYSLGATLFELLTNTPVVSGATVFECVNHVTHGKILRHPQVYREDLPRWVDALVARSLALLPADRFETAEAMRQAIDQHAAIDVVSVRRHLGELTAASVPGPERNSAWQVDTAVATRASTRSPVDSGPLVVVADSDTVADRDPSRQPDESARVLVARPHASPAPMDAHAADGRRPRLGSWLRTGLVAIAALGVGALAMALLQNRPAAPVAPASPPSAVDMELEPQRPDTSLAAGQASGPPPDELGTVASAEPEQAGEQPAPSAEASAGTETPVTGGDEEETSGAAEDPAAGEQRTRRPVRSRRTHRTNRTASTEPTGMITVNTIPTARVFIDGRDTGHSTPLNGYTVPAGAHRLELRLSDGTTHTYAIRVEAGESARLFRVLPH